MAPGAKVTVEVTLADLMGMVVGRAYDSDDDAYGVMTVADLVAGQVAALAVTNADLMREIRDQVKTRVRQAVDVAMSTAPVTHADDAISLQAMIIAEAQAQLRPNPASYQGTATPLAQYLADMVYRAIREPAVAAVARIEAEVEEIVQAEIRRQLEKVALRAGQMFTP